MESYDGAYLIDPCYGGSTRVEFYRVWHHKGRRRNGSGVLVEVWEKIADHEETQAFAKAAAQDFQDDRAGS